MIYRMSYKSIDSSDKSVMFYARSLDDLGKQILDYYKVSHASIHFHKLNSIEYEYSIDIDLNHLFKDNVGSVTMSNHYNGKVELINEL